MSPLIQKEEPVEQNELFPQRREQQPEDVIRHNPPPLRERLLKSGRHTSRLGGGEGGQSESAEAVFNVLRERLEAVRAFDRAHLGGRRFVKIRLRC